MNLGIQVSLDNKGAIKGIKQVENQVVQAGKGAQRASGGFSTLTKAVGALGVTIGAAGLVRGLNQSVKAFAEFEQQVTNVQNITEASAAEMGVFAEKLRDLPASLGNSVELTKGLYQALSSGVPQDNAIDFMTANAKAAKGNMADLTQTISASTSILAAFNLDASEAGGVLDAMTKTVDLGKLTFSDLANNIGKSASIAAAAGVSYNELFAATAQLTLGGLSVEESMTGIRAIMTATIQPTVDQVKAMEKYNVTLSASALEQQGFVGYMKSIEAAIGGNVEAMAELFPNVRAIGPALALVRENGDQFADTLDKINDSAGKVDRNFERMTETTAAQMEILKNSMNAAMITIGQELAPAMQSFVEWAVENLPGIAEGIVSIVKAIGEVIKWLDKWKAVLVPLAAAMAAFWATAKIQAWITSIQAAGVASTALGTKLTALAALATPFAALAAAIVGVTGAIAYLGLEWAKTQEGIGEAENLLSETQARAQKKLQEGLEINKISLQEFADELGVVRGENESLVESVQKHVQELIRQGKYGGDVQAVMKGLARAESEAGKAAVAAANNQKKATKIYEDAEKAVEALRAEMAEFGAEQAALAEQAEETFDGFYSDVEGVQQAMEDWLAITVTSQEELEELQEVGEDGMTAIEKKVRDLEREFSVTFRDELPSAVQDGVDEANKAAADIEIIPPGAPEEAKKSIFNSITGGISEALGKGFTGEWNSFMDLWDSLWQDAAKSMMGTLSDGLAMVFNGKDAEGNPFNIGNMIEDMTENAGIGSTIGGLGMVLNAREQGGAQGALQGAMGGMQAGAILGPIGMAVGAIAGGLIGYFGGKEDPASTVAIGNRQSRFTSTEYDREQEEVMEGRIRSLYDKFEAAYRGIFLSLGDASLGSILRQQGRVPVVDSGGRMDMTPDELYDWLAREALPDAFEEYYRPVLEQGLGDLGVSNATLDSIFSQLPDMTGDARIQFLADFVQTVVDINKSLEMADWDTFTDSINEDSFTTFTNGITATTDQMDLMMDSWRGMGLDDVVREVDAIGDAFDSALAGVAQMLHEIDSLRSGIQDGWAGMREDLALSQMTDPQKINYFQNQVEEYMNDLQNAQTPEEIERANNALAGAMQNLMRLVDPASGMGMGSESWGEYLDRMMEQASEVATAGLDAVEAEVRAAYDELVERLNRAADALLNFENAANNKSTTDAGFYDDDGNWVTVGAESGGAADSADKSMTIDLTTPITLNLQTFIDGSELKNDVYAEVNAELGAMYSNLVNIINARAPSID